MTAERSPDELPPAPWARQLGGVITGLVFGGLWMTFFLPGLMGNASRISSIAADLVLQWRLGDEGVSFRFTPPGGSLQRATEINPSAYQQLRPGSGVEVETVPQCPWICRLAQW